MRHHINDGFLSNFSYFLSHSSPFFFPPSPPLPAHIHTPYRMSVKRTSKQEKEEMARQAVKFEAMMRKQSLAQQASLPYLHCIKLPVYSLFSRPKRRRRKGVVSTLGCGNEANHITVGPILIP